ncbi:MarR family transcriptional regulator [Mycobacterium sp. CBMA 234]|uniref:MarR family winged helix-turn-helix transcriptional regulator n=1 Tax=Mycolicibacterium sp. CBMA 234 TaxID=1918495 RepID=UPI0012DDD2DA|nr:MarR family transcriptional regulator [Mycolicibacterium sp. CBMA 234]MUL66303.1 MarR family transcriptional regulator [Mycolicibacterium sp. CBMA 234]
MTGTDEGLSPEHETAWRTWLRAHALLVRDLDAELRRRHGLTLLTYDALVQLSEAPDRRLRMKDLADALVYSTSGLTRIVDNLEREGYARRDTDPGNRRTIFVTLTDDGFRALTAAWPTHLRGVRQHFADHASVSQARTMGAVFRRVVADFEPPRS